MSTTSPRPNKRRRPSRHRWLSDQVKRKASAVLRAKLTRPRVLTHRTRRVLNAMGQTHRPFDGRQYW